eukprot:CAMPEP_0182951762 /NCGR_PEP_ID=MMETSP0105_2-20130417/61434_1 /TAXON_ID=81532 ORGANISM="Acanthoeca-like sp., Strain 10tr" /NCGR_SAMPLE_ID=MMETSP0105_2 /ASSEMBLY_ACC=CAM_ASM_000205 /LENGTH=52 /DNA_ID=CAMNT_0025092081 /DNA_START=672 /DNA_END=830 /DNA_ORIENTATION=-
MNVHRNWSRSARTAATTGPIHDDPRFVISKKVKNCASWPAGSIVASNDREYV